MTKPVIFDEARAILDNQFELIKLREQLQPKERNEISFAEEFDVIVDFIAHDMKTPIGCVTGFAEELSEQFVEAEVSDEWNEYIGFIHKSAHDIDIILEALVMLKNLRLRQLPEPDSVSLEKVFEQVTSRYEQFAYLCPLEAKLSLNNCTVLSQGAQLEELVLILFRNFSNLVKEGCPLQMMVEAERTSDGTILLRLGANTRPMEDAELSNILAPLQGKKRNRVKDTNILLLCAQKIITRLAIKAWAEHGPDNTLNVCLYLKPGKD
jgi:light-regulated signal transduction histidine kinase (bacteriophytochrome)